MKDKQVFGGALLSYSAIIFNIISGLLYTPWMIHSIGDDQYALYTLAMSIINIFLMDFGIGSAVTKFLSNYYAHGEYEKANQFMGLVYKVFFVISILIAVGLGIFYFCIDHIYAKFSPTELVIFKNLFIIVAVYSILSFPFTNFNGVLMANEQFIAVKACNLGQRMFNVLLIVLFLYLDGGVYALVLVQAVSNVAFLFVKYLIIRKKTKQRVIWDSKDNMLAKNLFGFSIWITVMSLAQRCIFNIMPTFIAAFIGASAVTLFSLASTLEGYVFTFADAINGMFMPKISRILIQDDTEEKLSNLMSNVGRFHVYTLGLIYIGFICVGQQFVDLWMGKGYSAVYICAIILIFPSIIDVPQQVAKTSLVAKDVVKEQAYIYIGMAIVNVVLSIILLPMCGVYGAAIAICVAYLFRTSAMNYLYKKKLPINLWYYFKTTYCHWLIVAVLTLIFGCIIGCISFTAGWLELAIKIIVICVVYCILLWRFCLRKEDKQVIGQVLKKRKK